MDKKEDINPKQDKNQEVFASSPEISIKQEKIHDLLFSREIGWQEIIYDLINTEQLDPWDINISILANKYLQKLQEFEEDNYFISSKVLLAAALLLRIKSEIILNKYIKSIDEILFGKKQDSKETKGEILDLSEYEDETFHLIPKSPVPRFKRVSLNELVESLNKAIITENRRIKKEILKENAFRDTEDLIPKKKILIMDKVKEIYKKIIQNMNENERISFIVISGENKEEKISTFVSLLHLESQNKIWVEQENHFGEIFIWIKGNYLKKYGDKIYDFEEN
ncbi:segregation/condensation protein A [Candidatus Pacearchaeota archaeon]|nr:segregation/condensation protein A [Candidatus Pacearchaeota archaeon]